MNNPNDPKDLEQRLEKLESKVNQELTMVIGQNWKTEENLRLLRSEMSERLTRMDDRISALNQDSAEQLLAIRDIKNDLKEVLSLLKKGN